LKTRIVLSVGCSDIQAGRELARVLAPDNAGGPRGLNIVMNAEQGAVRFDISSESPSSALSTAMAILRDVSLFEQVWLLSRAPGA
jgi:hypothetical protein